MPKKHYRGKKTNYYRKTQPDKKTTTSTGRVTRHNERVWANIPGRDIPQDTAFRIIGKEKLKESDMSQNEIVVPLKNARCRFPQDYHLSNLPIHIERSCMQNYHIPFTNEQLGQMVTSPKIIIDRWHNSFVFDNQVMHRTSFYAIAPNGFEEDLSSTNSYPPFLNQSYIPVLYRFSVSQNIRNKSHFSISVHAIVGGKEDGWLFLARLDNNSKTPHNFVSDPKVDVVKKYNAIPVPQSTDTSADNLEQEEVYKSVIHKISFPHLHQANTNYALGDDPEKGCPKFLKKCVSNSFEENLGFMMKIFHIHDVPHFCSKDARLEDLMGRKRNSFTINPEPDPSFLIKEISLLTQYNSSTDYEKTAAKINEKTTERGYVKIRNQDYVKRVYKDYERIIEKNYGENTEKKEASTNSKYYQDLSFKM